MERNRWETAIRCLEVAVHPNTSDDEMIAAVNGFRRTVEGLPLSQVCIEFACGGVPLADLAQMKDTLERMNRDNLELRRKLAVEEAAQASTARRLDDAYHRIYQLTEEAMAARRLAEAAEQEFEEFRAAYAEALDSMKQSNAGLRSALDEAKRSARRPFSALLAEARLAAGEAAAFNSGVGSGRLRLVDPGEPWTA
jgi:septal ring factor EnvC (AmiA/AmiB activator)